MSRFGKGITCIRDEGEEPVVNLTPLIDVVFVILIIFIVIAPFLEIDQIELANTASKDLNNQAVTSLHKKSPITIYVKNDNTIKLNQEQLLISELVPRLKRLQESYPTDYPQLFHDRTAYFGTYQAVKNAVEEAGFSQLEIILQPQ